MAEARREADPLTVACPDCGSAVGEPCRTQAERLAATPDYDAIFREGVRGMVLNKLACQLDEAATAADIRRITKEIDAVRASEWRP